MMKKLSFLSMALILLPLAAFAILAALHPVGDPQKSGSVLVRLLDYQGTYMLRELPAVPPPGLLLGWMMSLLLLIRNRSKTDGIIFLLGTGMLAICGLLALVPLMLHVN